MTKFLTMALLAVAILLTSAACSGNAPTPTPVRREVPARPTATPIPQAFQEEALPRPTPTAPPSAATAPPPAATAPPSESAPSGTTFQEYVRERFVSAAVDNVSTFSLDTDRTSYYLALNWARTGYKVEPDSVRAEEWINAFNYNYQRPLRDDSFAISSDVIRHPLDRRMHIARVALQAAEVDYDATPINVTLVLDASGSMGTGNRVNIAREAAESIRRSLRGHDRIAVVHFSNDVLREHTVPPTQPTCRQDWTGAFSLPTGRDVRPQTPTTTSS